MPISQKPLCVHCKVAASSKLDTGNKISQHIDSRIISLLLAYGKRIVFRAVLPIHKVYLPSPIPHDKTSLLNRSLRGPIDMEGPLTPFP